MQFWVLFDLRPESHRWWHPYVLSPIWFFICQSFYHWNWDSLGKYYIFNPPKNSSREKSLFGEVRREDRGWGWMGRKYEWQLTDFHKMLKSSVGFIGFVQGPPCGVLEGSGRVQSGIWPQLFPSCYHHWPQCTAPTTNLKQIKKKERTFRQGRKSYVDMIKYACRRYLPGQIKEMFRSGRSSQPRRQVYLSTPQGLHTGPEADAVWTCSPIFLGCLQVHVWPCVNARNRV